MDFLNSTETDIAYHLLTQKGEPIYYKDLVLEVIEKKAKPVQSLPHAISEIYTLINMDSRFQHRGHGHWGLTEWTPPEPKRSHGTSSSAAASTATAEPAVDAPAAEPAATDTADAPAAEPVAPPAAKKTSRRREKASDSKQEE